MRCPYCGGRIFFEIGYVAHGPNMARIRAEDRVYCINCAAHRYMTETRSLGPKGRPKALPLEALAVGKAARAREAAGEENARR